MYQKKEIKSSPHPPLPRSSSTSAALPLPEPGVPHLLRLESQRHHRCRNLVTSLISSVSNPIGACSCRWKNARQQNTRQIWWSISCITHDSSSCSLICLLSSPDLTINQKNERKGRRPNKAHNLKSQESLEKSKLGIKSLATVLLFCNLIRSCLLPP